MHDPKWKKKGVHVSPEAARGAAREVEARKGARRGGAVAGTGQS